MNKEKTLECLHQLGFTPEPAGGDYGFSFSYEGLTLIYTPEDDETHCLTLTLPGIFDITEENRTAVLEAMVNLCANMRYVQPVITFDSVWIHYQHYMGEEGVPTPDLLEHMIRVLAVSLPRFRKTIDIKFS